MNVVELDALMFWLITAFELLKFVNVVELLLLKFVKVVELDALYIWLITAFELLKFVNTVELDALYELILSLTELL